MQRFPRVRLTVLCVALLCTLLGDGCQTAPTGPDGKPLPGATGGPVIPKPRQLTEPPDASFIVPAEGAVRTDMKAHADKNEGEVDVVYKVGDPPQTVTKKVKWKRLNGGKYQIIFPPGEGSTVETTVTVTPTKDGLAETKVIDGVELVNHYGPSYMFVGTTDCKDAIWVQYVKREFTFTDAAGADKGKKTIGPEIDEQIPYRIQSQPSGGGPVMEDSPGISDKLTNLPKETAPGAIEKLKKDAGNTADGVTKAVVTWSFWTYLICLDPYSVLGHYEWGFTLTVDTQNKPYIKQSDTREPTWTAGK